MTIRQVVVGKLPRPSDSLQADEMRILTLDSAPLLFKRAERILPLTVFSLQASEASMKVQIHSQIRRWLEIDDVFTTSFLSHVVVTSNAKVDMEGLSRLHDELRRDWGTKVCTSASPEIFEQNLSHGPYLIWGDDLCKPFKLYDDSQQAFMLATKPRLGSDQPFENLHLSGSHPASLSVAVPTKIQQAHDPKRPLKGLRFAVKDLFHLKGLRQTLGCRSYYDVAEEASETAILIQKLIDLGAELVGTLKLGSLITKEEPAESADYLAPFNPRGDGYQSAWSSSGGSGAAVAAYDWLDFTLGSDTTGSSRRPALANGCFQMRLSHDVLPLDGIIPSFRPFDAPAIFGRDLTELQKIVGAWTSLVARRSEDLPLKIAYLGDYFPIGDETQQELVEEFVRDLASALSAEVLKFSLADRWKACPPIKANDASIEDFLKDVGVDSFCYGLYHELDTFRSRYHEKFKKEPYVNPTTRWRWNAAQNVTHVQYTDAMDRLSIYKDWLLDEILRVEEHNTLVIIPISTQAVDYRDEPAEPPSAPSAFQPLWLAPILGAPEISVPIGELKYSSRVTLRDEYLPVVVSIMGTPGTDMDLLSTILMALKQSKRPTTVATGSRML